MFDVQSPWQWLVDMLQGWYDNIIYWLNPVNVVIGVAQQVASMLPEADPRVAEVAQQMSDAVHTVVKYVALFDYLINLPVLLVVVSIIFVAETAFNVYRGWRIVRSAIT